jgi:aryl-alcohol dehydrogenase-like predicted oxidoreductase
MTDDDSTTTDLTIRLGGDTPVHRLGFGAMRLTGWNRTDGPPNGIEIARRALDLGVTLIDTADSYAIGANEELLAEALHPYPADLVIATKAGQSRPGCDSWVPLGRPEYLHQQAELSLRRLKVECIGLYQLHRVDPAVPLADQVGVLDDLRRAGKVRHVGLSEVTVEQIREAQEVTRIDSVQNLYNLDERLHDDVLAYCEAQHIAFLSWKPISYGNPGATSSALATVATELGASRVQIAIAWLLARSAAMVPIPGTSSIEHLEENWQAANIHLEPAHLDLLGERG